MTILKNRRLTVLNLLAIISILLASPGFLCAETEHFEKGYLIFTEGFLWYGHTAIYFGWDGINDTEERTNHLIIESVRKRGVIPNDYSFLYGKGYKGAGTLYLTAVERRLIAELAYSRLGYKFSRCLGYKDRLLFDRIRLHYRFFKTYRCDGLAEHCYEIATGTYGIVIDTHWDGALPGGLSPTKQQNAMVSNLEELPYINPDLINRPLGIKPRVNITNLSDDEILTGVYTLEAHADDGDYGSGIAQVEFWVGGLGSIPNIIIVI